MNIALFHLTIYFGLSFLRAEPDFDGFDIGES